jgi:hypothetical protein
MKKLAFLPTFYPNAATVEDAKVIDIVLDQEAEQINIRPTFGKTFTLSGEVVGQCDGRISVSLISSLEQITESAPRTFSFTEPFSGPLRTGCRLPGSIFVCLLPANATFAGHRQSVDPVGARPRCSALF